MDTNTNRAAHRLLPYLWTALVAAALILLARPLTALAQDGATTNDLLAYELNTVEIVETYGDSVVAVDVTIAGRSLSPDDVFPRQLFPRDMLPEPFRDLIPEFMMPQMPQQQRDRQTAGSGFVIDDEGHILTNYHVIEGALASGGTDLSEGSAITVTFPGGEPLSVRVVGANAMYDLALLALEDPAEVPAGVIAIELGDTASLRPGQKAIAIGNPFGFASTVTQGIVSAVGRHFPYIGEVEFELVQTDAAINPGSSGGPLLDSSGRLIGVNTAIIPSVSVTGDRGNLGIGFAVPADIVARVLPELREGGLVSTALRPRLGIEFRDLADYPEDVRRRLGLPGEGVGVYRVEAGSGAEEAGIQGSTMRVELAGGALVDVPGDIIVAANGVPVNRGTELQNIIFSLSAGDVVTLTILRDGEELEIDVTLMRVPQEAGN